MTPGSHRDNRRQLQERSLAIFREASPPLHKIGSALGNLVIIARPQGPLGNLL
jgi:hypothetical protein